MDRYYLKELSFPFFVLVSAFIVLGLIDFMYSLFEQVINRGVPFGIVLKLLLYKVPIVVVIILPYACLFSVMLVILKSILDNEMVVLWTCGIKYERVFAPIIVFAVFVTASAFILSEYFVPMTNYKSNTLYHRVLLKESIPLIDENIFFRDVGNRYFYIRKIEKDKNLMEDVMVYELDNKQPQVILAKRARWDGNSWTLSDGKIHRYNSDGYFDFEALFDTLQIKVEYDINMVYEKVKNTKEMSSNELAKRIKAVDAAGLDSKKLKVEYYLKYATPYSNLIFAFIGIILIFIIVKSSKHIWGVVLSIILAVGSVSFFYVLTAFFRAFGIAGKLSPVLSAWSPNIVYFIFFLAVWVIYRLYHL
ncbi:MAG: hypothetical protein A2Y40_04125 [Candidatus Margulisbacteria bacterium GWF2_35_9]|nr:MAG: hypothetical protein A2Y40_04125 [Candidatus Margulisbacteria bacterium GWF2_35_9]